MDGPTTESAGAAELCGAVAASASGDVAPPLPADASEDPLHAWHAGSLHSTPDASDRRISAVSFDLDDTLWENSGVLESASAAGTAWMVDRFPHAAPALEARPLGERMEELRSTAAHLAHCYSALRREAMRQVLDEAGVAPEAAEAAIGDGMAHYLKARSAVTLWPGVEATLRALRARGLRLAALSNGNVDVAHVAPLPELLDVHLHPGKMGCAKPDVEPFHMVAAELGVPRNEVLHVGDSYDHDALAAIAAGLQGAWLHGPKDGVTPAAAAELPVHAVVSHVGALVAYVDAVNGPPVPEA